jgi:hypothetical protein
MFKQSALNQYAFNLRIVCFSGSLFTVKTPHLKVQSFFNLQTPPSITMVSQIILIMFAFVKV